MDTVDGALQALRSKGLKITPQRIAILKVLQGNTSHPSAEEIYKKVTRKHPNISFTTIYNTLDVLKKTGQIRELIIDKTRKHFDPDLSPHNHLICDTCHTIFDIFEDFSDAITIPQSVSDVFHVTGHEIVFYGICKECLQKTGN